MRSIRLALGAALLVGTVALAQPPGGPGGFGGFGGFGGGGLSGMIGQNKQLQEELKVDKDQADKLQEAMTKVREEMRDVTAKLRDRNVSQDERAEIMRKVSEANQRALATVLNTNQIKRLHQIENQQAGLNMFTKEDVQKALKLSDEQKEKITAIRDDLRKDMRDAMQAGGGGGGFNPEAMRENMKKVQGLQKEAMTNVQGLLSDSQKGALKDLTGETFTLTMQGPGGAGGAGGFGRGGAGGFGAFGGGRSGVMSSQTQEALKLNDAQKKQIEELQKEVDSKVEKILTEEQNKQLKGMRDTRGGPGGPGAPGGRGPGGRGGQGGERNRPGRPGGDI